MNGYELTPEDRQDDLYAAILGDDLDTLASVLAGGAKVNLRVAKRGIYPLMQVCVVNDAVTHEKLTLLLEAGADMRVRLRNGDGVLHCAARCSGKVMRLVLDALGEDAATIVNQVNQHGWHPLYPAVIYDRVGCVRELLGAGANPNQVAAGNPSPLMFATNWPLAAVLIDGGADVSYTDAGGWDLFKYALVRKYPGCPEIVKELIHRYPTYIDRHLAGTPFNDRTPVGFIQDLVRQEEGNLLMQGAQLRTQQDYLITNAILQILTDYLDARYASMLQ